jgi:hypothetical protein
MEVGGTVNSNLSSPLCGFADEDQLLAQDKLARQSAKLSSKISDALHRDVKDLSRQIAFKMLTKWRSPRRAVTAMRSLNQSISASLAIYAERDKYIGRPSRFRIFPQPAGKARYREITYAIRTSLDFCGPVLQLHIRAEEWMTLFPSGEVLIHLETVLRHHNLPDLPLDVLVQNSARKGFRRTRALIKRCQWITTKEVEFAESSPSSNILPFDRSRQ